MKIFAYDFETTGMVNWGTRSEDPGQPHIVQAGAALVDGKTLEIISSLDLVVRAADWEIDAGAQKVHGISQERTLEVGVSESLVVALMMDMWEMADFRLGHNESFDARIMRIALMRYADEEEADRWKDGESKCTANLATPIMKMPPSPRMRAAGRNHPKKPKLTEAYQHFMGSEMPDAHKAMGDVLGCLAIYGCIMAHAEANPLAVVKSEPAESTKTSESGDDGLSFLE